MEIKINSLPKSQLEILLTLNQTDLASFKNQALQELGANLTLKGYRQGKAPLDLIAQQVSATELTEKMALLALDKFYPQLIKEHHLEPVGQPLVTLTKLIPESLVEFKLTLSILPKWPLKNYQIIAQNKQKERKKATVTEAEIQESLTWLQKTKKSPTLDDQFAQSLGNFKNLEELKQNIKEGLLLEKQDKENERWRLAVLEEIINQNPFEVPEILIESEKEKMLDELKIRLSEIQLSFEDYLKQIKKTEADLLQEFTPLAEKRVKMALVLKEIAQKENITVSQEEIEVKVNEILSQFPDPELKNQINLEELKTFAEGLIKNEKVFELLEKQPKKEQKSK